MTTVRQLNNSIEPTRPAAPNRGGGSTKVLARQLISRPFGVSWLIIPTAPGQMLEGKDPKKAQAVMQAMLQMTKIDIAALRRAYEQN